MEEFKFLKLIDFTGKFSELRIAFRDHKSMFVCNEHLIMEVSNDFLKENYTKVDLSVDNVGCFIKIIQKYHYPEPEIIYQLGKYVTNQSEQLAKYAKALYLQFNRRNRLTIQAFCLFCIRYHKDRINKDVRRKICEYIIDFID